MSYGTLNTSLNGICPYFTMFPLEFPYSILHRYAKNDDWVVDPFCGRGTTNYASRLLGLPSVGIDSSPVAVASSQAKLADTSPKAIITAAEEILNETRVVEIPTGEFWELAFNADVLHTICRLREGLMLNCDSDARRALRAILMGALHGPRAKVKQSYLSNQCQRTYAPKPVYAVRFWKKKELKPPQVNVLEIVEERAKRYYNQVNQPVKGQIIQGDSRSIDTFSQIPTNSKIRWIITSPPYYGMRTYLPDQWLRLWFAGGSPNVDYSTTGQIEHSSPATFSAQLRQVWLNLGEVCQSGARLIIRFGGINDRKVAPLPILKHSLQDSGWKIQTLKSAGYASQGRRQSLHFSNANKKALEEYDVWARWDG